MTDTATLLTPSTEATGKITKDIQERIQQSIFEMRLSIKERSELIADMWAARVAQLHLLMLGPGGTAKSMVVRRMVQHIEGAVHFETAFDETTDPGQFLGPPDIKGMVDEGKNRRVITGMLPEATDAFLDEIFNGNGPALHALMPILNERLFHNNGHPIDVPLRSAYMGTNKLNADADMAAMWDRVHIRHIVEYVKDRDNKAAMVGEAIARMALVGRGTSTIVPGEQVTKLTLEELDQAHTEALALNVPDAVVETFFDIQEELEGGKAQTIVSDRRVVEGMVAVLGNAYIRGHETVQVGDLDILANMWWTLQEQRADVRAVILQNTNPGEKAALDLLDQLDLIKTEVREAGDRDPSTQKRVAVEQVTNVDRLIEEAKEHLVKTQAAGMPTARIEEVIARSDAYKAEVAEQIFGITASGTSALQNAARV